MGDAKRGHNNAAKTAMPKSGGPAQPEALESLSSAAGARVRLTTVSPASTTIEGTLFTACPVFNVVAVDIVAASTSTSTSTAAVATKGDYHIIPMSRIQSFEVLSLAPKGNPVLPAIGALDTRALRDGEDARIRELQELKRKTGVGVPTEAQMLFDVLYRIYPTTWRGQDIQVSNAVIISPPYTRCRPFPGKETTLQRFQMIVDGERKKMAQRSGQPIVSAESSAGK